MHTACLLFQNLPLHQQTKGYNHDNELCWLWAFYYLFAEERKQIILLLYDLGSCTVRFTVEWKTIEAFWPRAFAFFADWWEETLNTRFNAATLVQGCNALLETWTRPQHANTAVVLKGSELEMRIFNLGRVNKDCMLWACSVFPLTYRPLMSQHRAAWYPIVQEHFWIFFRLN